MNLPRVEYLQSLGFTESDFVALFIGNLKKNKGLDVLFDAFIALAPDFPNLRLLVTTEMEHQNYLERKTSLENKLFERGLTNKVVWLGFVDNIIGLIRDVDVVVAPFLNLNGISNYPLVVLEAISVGTPVVATNLGGTPEVLNNNVGILVPPGDVGALSRGLRRIMTLEFGEKVTGSKNSPLRRFEANVVGQKYHALFLHEVNKNN